MINIASDVLKPNDWIHTRSFFSKYSFTLKVAIRLYRRLRGEQKYFEKSVCIFIKSILDIDHTTDGKWNICMSKVQWW